LGGLGDDFFYVSPGEDVIVGGEGRDWLGQYWMAGPVIMNLTTGETVLRKRPWRPEFSYGIDTISSVENLHGTDKPHDILIGNHLRNYLWGGDGGHDTLRGRGGDDIAGGSGDDTFRGGYDDDRFTSGLGNETIYGGPGTDTVEFGRTEDNHGVRANLRKGMATGAGLDRLAGIENLAGTGFGDTFIGDSRANVLDGRGTRWRAGEDTLIGGRGNDLLIGHYGDPRDALDGGGDTDTCRADPRDIVVRCEVS
jgi:Ca2+-binding RTX toxin-like protein